MPGHAAVHFGRPEAGQAGRADRAHPAVAAHAQVAVAGPGLGTGLARRRFLSKDLNAVDAVDRWRDRNAATHADPVLGHQSAQRSQQHPRLQPARRRGVTNSSQLMSFRGSGKLIESHVKCELKRSRNCIR